MRTLVRVLFVTLLLVAGCDPGVNTPKEPVWGKQPCEHCAMLLSDKEHGAQLVTGQGDRLYFDEVGCLVAWTLEHPGSALHQWVRTADTQAWVPAETAGYERSERTPMGFGFIAAAKPGAVSWSQVTDAVQQKLRRQER